MKTQMRATGVLAVGSIPIDGSPNRSWNILPFPMLTRIGLGHIPAMDHAIAKRRAAVDQHLD